MRPRLCRMRSNYPIDDLFFALPAEPDDVNVRLKRAVALAIRRVVVGGDFSKSTTSACQCQMLESRRLLSVDLFSDTNPNPNTGTTSSAFVFDYNGSLYFNADDGTHGVELYKSNGTPAGTSMLKDINPTGSSSPQSYCVVNGVFYFTADDGTHGRELWKTDGTSDGTQMVADINPTTSSTPAFLVALNNLLIFSADDGSHGREMWTYDGANLTLIDIRQNSTAQALSTPFTVFNNRVWFAGNDGSGTGIELWSSDGTPGGTSLAFDIFPGAGSQSFPNNLTVCNGALYFSALTTPDAIEPWRYDGIAGHAPYEIKNIKPSGSSSPSNFTAYNGLTYFAADDGTHGVELWVSDGTDGGTQMVKDINTQTSGSNASSPTGLFVFNGSLYFDADDGSKGPELYKSDGTGPGTNLLKEINPAFFNGSGFVLPTVLNNAMYFIANGGSSTGVELWRSDGTTTGTVMVRDIAPGSTSSMSTTNASMRVFNGSLYFYANDNTHGNEVWKLSPQAATSTGFNVNTPAVTVTFNDPAIVNNTAATYTIENLSAGGTLSPLSVSYDAPSRTASFALPTNLADGRYRLTIPTTAATDAYGNWMASTYTADFFVLTGDANHNGVVDTADFTALAQNFNSQSATYAQGDFNRDGVVNSLDFNALATRYGASLPAPTISGPLLFSAAPIDSDPQRLRLVSILD